LWQALAKGIRAQECLDVPYTAFLIVSGNRKVLMNMGFSDNGGPPTERLMMNLNASGYTAPSIKDMNGDLKALQLYF